MSIYDTAVMLKAVEQFPRDYSFLYDYCVDSDNPVEDSEAIYDYRKGSLRMSPIVHDYVGGVLMARDGFDTRKIGFCRLAPERIVTINDISKRSFGENVMGAKTPEQRAKELLARDLTDMKQSNQLRREWMVRQVLLTGKLEIFKYTNEGRDKETTMVADYGFTNNFSPDNAWDTANATIDEDMQEMCDLVYDGGGYIDRFLMHPNVFAAMKKNSNYIKQFDGLHVNMGEINTRYMTAGIRFVGWNSDGVEMYTVSGKFVNDNGQHESIIPGGTIVGLSRGIMNAPHGPITQVEDPGQKGAPKTYIKKEVPLRIANVGTNSVTTRLTSCPTVVPVNVDGWVVGHVL